MGVDWGVRERKRLHDILLGGAGGILSYFKDIRQGALQPDCVMFGVLDDAGRGLG